VAALPEVLRMAVGHVGIAPFDAEPPKRRHILRERPRATEPGVEVVDLLDGKHDGCGLRYQSRTNPPNSLRPDPPEGLSAWQPGQSGCDSLYWTVAVNPLPQA